jgi:GABA(A) receptor-associated protein
MVLQVLHRMATSEASLALRPQDVSGILARHPDKVPIFVLRSPKADPTFPTLPKAKFMVPKSITLGMFSYVIRKHMVLPPEKALFLFIDNSLEPSSVLISDLYARHKSPDGALRIIYTSESVFGDYTY